MDWSTVLEESFSCEVLEVRVLNPALNDGLIEL